MLAVSDRFAAMQDGTEKTALAVKLFGRAGLDMIPMLNMGRNALAEMIAEGQRLNPVTTESARQAEIFNDNMTRLGKTFSAVGVAFLNDLLPVISELSQIFADDALAGDVKKVGAGMDELAPKSAFLGEALKALVIVGGNVGFVLKGIGTELGGLAAQFVAFISGNSPGRVPSAR
ncbi:MAG: hypothetical protein IPH30_17050 [Betaproteobacteria bacterium]|nr:hypothetical protein [Betaproteobacteria bacterium]